jgi:hypothetical protein
MQHGELNRGFSSGEVMATVPVVAIFEAWFPLGSTRFHLRQPPFFNFFPKGIEKCLPPAAIVFIRVTTAALHQPDRGEQNRRFIGTACLRGPKVRRVAE